MRTSESKATGNSKDSSAPLNPKFAIGFAALARELRVRGTRYARQSPDRRLRLAGDAAHRATRARGEGLLRDRAVPEGRGRVPGAEAEGGHSLRWACFGARARRATRPYGDLSGRRAGARHLLRRA